MLVPSFSSKGFGFSKSGKSDVKDICSIASEYLTETMLISAFDIACEYLPIFESAITELTFVDSGGYEISDSHDLSAVYRHPLKVKEQDWSVEKLTEVYSSWPEHIPAVFVGYDHPDLRKPLHEQIELAKKLLLRYPKQLHTLLIKPETYKQKDIQVKNVVASCEDLSGFHIIGFTEKELGSSILKRMANIAEIRIAMDDKNIKLPIHIYGSLDPITSILYFLSGAEIFDGLTWLRYGYANGHACYWSNYGAKAIGIDRVDDFIKAKTIQENLSSLVELTRQMQKFLLDYDFNRFVHDPGFFKDCYDLLRTKNKRI
ncbi:MAG: hypothetical protein ACUZ8N_03080 [Candidatus Scalindua sp.]